MSNTSKPRHTLDGLPHIHLDDNYDVIIWPYEYQLTTHHVNRNTGETIYTSLGHFPSLKHALQWLKRIKMRQEINQVSINDYIKKLDKLENWVNKILKDHHETDDDA